MATTNKQMEELMSPDDMMMPQEDVTKERAVKAAKDVLTFGAESTPVLGEIIAAKRTGDAIQEGDYIGAAVEAAAGALGIVPIVGDAAGRALRSATRSLRKDAKLTVDNPGYNEIYGETYAETKQRSSDKIKKRAVDRGEVDTYQVNLGSSEGVTGYANKVKFKPEELKDLPGAMGEEKFRSTGETIIDGEVAYNKLKGLKESIAKEGYNPKGSIMIHVREDGQPFIVEGNHRLAEALESGRETIDADIRYLRGAEEKAGPLDPRYIFPDKRAPLPKYNLKDPDSRVFHLTKKDYDAADVVGKGTDDIGFHVGTAQQASARGSSGNPNYSREMMETMTKGERVLPMVLKANLKPARIVDLSSFKQPRNWLANLSVDSSDRQIMAFLKGDSADSALLKKAPRVKADGKTYIMSPDAMRAGVDPDLWEDLILEASRARRVGLDTINKQEDRLQWFSTLKGVANKHGYDSFVYKNEYEGIDKFSLDDVSDQAQDSYMLLEADQAKGIFGGLTEGEPEFMKNRGGVISMKKGGVAKQMEMFEPVERGFNSGALVGREKLDVTIFDFNEIANSYNDALNRSGRPGAITGDEMMALFDAFLDIKNTAKTSGMNEGGLAEEGGTVDPISGNSVPPGSTKEEVRDDIPAQLSEGEFVFPADVVRYIGLEKLMRLRQEAKMGLAAMEAMGQMGNSEEAVMPDDLPFDMYDLDIEDDNEYNMAQGGVVKMQQGGTNYTPPSIGGFTPPPPVTTGFSGPQPVQPFQSGQTQFKVAGAGEGAVTPKTAVDPVVPTFSDFIGQNIPGVDFTMVTFYDENGQAKVLKKFPDGSFEDPANPGTKVTPADMGLTEEIKTETTPTQQRVETAKVVDTGDDKDPGSTQTQIGWGGEPDPKNPGLKTGVTMVDFSVIEVPGMLPGVAGTLAGSAQALMGKDYPDNAKLGISIDGVTTVVSGADYNAAKKGANGLAYTGDVATSVLEKAKANAVTASKIMSAYGVKKNPYGNKTIEDFYDEAARSDKSLKDMAADFDIDFDDLKDNPFADFFGKDSDAAFKDFAAASNKRGIEQFGKGNFKETTVEDIEAYAKAKVNDEIYKDSYKDDGFTGLASDPSGQVSGGASQEAADAAKAAGGEGPSAGYSQADYDAGFDTGYD